MFSITSTQALRSTTPPIHLVPEVVFPRVKRQEREVDYSRLSSTEVKSDGALPPIPHKFSLHGA